MNVRMMPQLDDEDVLYPDSDRKPMADNTLQFRHIVMVQGGLDSQYRNDPNVLVVGDLLWYPERGHPEISAAPDTMVIFGRPKGDRGSYRQWREGNVAPQVVFEILSPNNTRDEMERKFEFYQRYGVAEYYVYDPDHLTLEGYQRVGEELQEIADLTTWVSPRLGIRFDLSGTEHWILGPDNQPFKFYLDLTAERERERKAHERAEKAQKKAEAKSKKEEERRIHAEKAQKKAEAKGKKEEEKRKQVEEELKKAEEMAKALGDRLRSLGIDPDS